VLSAAQAGKHDGIEGGTRNTFGHSLAIGPWGTVIGELDGQNESVVFATLEKEKVQEVRRQIPMKQHRRL
jgi:predicted amidohydrolase